MATAASVLGPRKTVEDALASTEETGFTLKKDLSRLDIVVFGVGVMVGAGIFVLTGQAAATEAGPAVTLSFVLAAVVCFFAALCYTEFAAMVPVAGSAYTFSYATLGQLIAFVIGWDLVLEFTVGAAAVAVGASGFIDAILSEAFGAELPTAISAAEEGTLNLPAVVLVAVLATLLYCGIRITAKANLVLVAVTLGVLALIVVLGSTKIDVANWGPYFPFGFSGVVGGAALVFFAFIGFDIVATTAEESRDPQRDMPWGIVGSLALVTLLYVAVAGVVTGMLPFRELTGEAPVADAFRSAFDSEWITVTIFAGALVALTNTVMVLLLGQSRVAFAMSRDSLLPRALARTHDRRGTPYRITLITATVVAVLAGFLSLETLAKLVNIGTLFAFGLVAAGVLYLRRADPARLRPFRTPLVPLIPLLAIVGCIYLAKDLDGATWLRFLIWMALGLVVYFAWARGRASAAARRAAG
jgi:APA family basic amino acid/polyamine antiporter